MHHIFMNLQSLVIIVSVSTHFFSYVGSCRLMTIVSLHLVIIIKKVRCLSIIKIGSNAMYCDLLTK